MKNLKTFKRLTTLGLSFILMTGSCSSEKITIDNQKNNVVTVTENKLIEPQELNNDKIIIETKSIETTDEINKNIHHDNVEVITINAIGDCTLGGDFTTKYNNNFHEYADLYGIDYFFESVKHIFEKDDITIANLECALTTKTKYADKKWKYSGHPDYANALSNASIEVVSLANNHTLDFFKEGLEDTKEALKIVDVNYAYKDIITYKTIKGIKIAIISVAWDSDEKIKKYIDTAINNTDLQIVCLHSGINYEKNYNPTQERLAHMLVDHGADLVLGTHPHILQGIELYKGVYIAYSLGNFCYGGKRNLGEENDTMIFQVLFKYINKDLTDTSIKIIPAYMSSSFPINDYKPTIVEDEKEQERIKQKILNLSKNIQYK